MKLPSRSRRASQGSPSAGPVVGRVTRTSTSESGDVQISVFTDVAYPVNPADPFSNPSSPYHMADRQEVSLGRSSGRSRKRRGVALPLPEDETVQFVHAREPVEGYDRVLEAKIERFRRRFPGRDFKFCRVVFNSWRKFVKGVKGLKTLTAMLEEHAVLFPIESPEQCRAALRLFRENDVTWSVLEASLRVSANTLRKIIGEESNAGKRTIPRILEILNGPWRRALLQHHEDAPQHSSDDEDLEVI